MSEILNNESLITIDYDTLLTAKNLSHEFDYKLFRNINLSLSKKESIAIIGNSGSGK
jgi:putative ABC transport system ATP-binding protein